jgi:hypothetical protein
MYGKFDVTAVTRAAKLEVAGGTSGENRLA